MQHREGEFEICECVRACGVMLPWEGPQMVVDEVGPQMVADEVDPQMAVAEVLETLSL